MWAKRIRIANGIHSGNNKDIKSLWLSTAPGTRAERFYQKTGWEKTGTTSTGEIRFEMNRDIWLKNR